ncbi:hypothetical protein MYX84_16205 [Acidobacteria bacterium AH-259-O06]|nr:hypothetical protein [Acidobacteria bacterium AH-259-O06]
MKISWIIVITCTLLCNATLSGQVRSQLRGFVDQDYVLALSTANKFLSAWQTRDQAAGLSLLSPSLRSRDSEDELRLYISGLSNPYHASFEIGPGEQLPDGRFAFEVRLYEHYRGQRIQERRLRPTPSRIVLIQIGPEDWLVDQLP